MSMFDRKIRDSLCSDNLQFNIDRLLDCRLLASDNREFQTRFRRWTLFTVHHRLAGGRCLQHPRSSPPRCSTHHVNSRRLLHHCRHCPTWSMLLLPRLHLEGRGHSTFKTQWSGGCEREDRPPISRPRSSRRAT